MEAFKKYLLSILCIQILPHFVFVKILYSVAAQILYACALGGVPCCIDLDLIQ